MPSGLQPTAVSWLLKRRWTGKSSRLTPDNAAGSSLLQAALALFRGQLSGQPAPVASLYCPEGSPVALGLLQLTLPTSAPPLLQGWWWCPRPLAPPLVRCSFLPTAFFPCDSRFHVSAPNFIPRPPTALHLRLPHACCAHGSIIRAKHRGPPEWEPPKKSRLTRSLSSAHSPSARYIMLHLPSAQSNALIPPPFSLLPLL